MGQIELLIPLASSFLGVIIGGLITYVATKSIKKMELEHSYKKEKAIAMSRAHIDFVGEFTTIIDLYAGDKSLTVSRLNSSVASIDVYYDRDTYAKAKNLVRSVGKYLSDLDEIKDQEIEITPEVLITDSYKIFIEAKEDYTESARKALKEVWEYD